MLFEQLTPKALFLSKVTLAVSTVLPAPNINKRRMKNPQLG